MRVFARGVTCLHLIRCRRPARGLWMHEDIERLVEKALLSNEKTVPSARVLRKQKTALQCSGDCDSIENHVAFYHVASSDMDDM